MREVVFGVLEVACVLLVAFGFGLWANPGCGLVVGGALGLMLLFVVQMSEPKSEPEQKAG